jgi:hypothetical protein
MRSKHNEEGQFPAGCPPFDREVYGPIWQRAKASQEHKLSEEREGEPGA